jgi:hypothetical protein
MAEKEYIERKALDDFKDDLMGRFIDLCFGNDYNKLQLLTIGNTIDELYEKYRARPSADVVEVVRCRECSLCHTNSYGKAIGVGSCRGPMQRVVSLDGFCSYGPKTDGGTNE